MATRRKKTAKKTGARAQAAKKTRKKQTTTQRTAAKKSSTRARASKKSPARKRRSAKKAPRARRAAAGYHELVSRAVTDAVFLERLLADPEGVIDKEFKLSNKERYDVLQVLGNPVVVRKAVRTFRARMGRPSVMAT